MAVVLWQVEEYPHVWRDFPPGLSAQTEGKYQEWIDAGRCPGSGFPVDEFLSVMQQINTKTGKWRSLRRLPLAAHEGPYLG